MQSEPPRSHSAPSRLENLHTPKRQTWHERPQTRENVDAVNVEGGEPQPPVPSCDTGIYKKLDESKRQIRVLELYPGSGEEPVSGNLITVDLPTLPPDFNEHVFLDQLVASSEEIIRAVRFGDCVWQDDIDRWEFIQNSLIWLFRYRLLELYHILRDAHGTPEADTAGRLKGMRLSSSATDMQRIPNDLATALLSDSAHHLWAHDLNDLIFCLCVQGTRSRQCIAHFAEQMDAAIDKFVSEDYDGDGMSALTSVDIPGLERFLAEVDLGLCTRFSAVSWFWGDAEHRDKMELDGQFLDIPFNAVHALRDLRDSVHFKWLWIEAVCINQNDKAERASQISLMSDIYSSAALTYVWLGNDDAVMQRAILHLQNVLRNLQIAADHGIRVVQDADGSPSGTSNLPAETNRTPFMVAPASAKKTLEELLHQWPTGHQMTKTEWQSEFILRRGPPAWPMFELPWFSRLWVFQEVVLSRHCTIVFGPNTTLSWKDLEDGAWLMNRCIGVPKGLKLTLAVRKAREWRRSNAKFRFQLLQSLVARNIDQKCSDPRDYVFGVLGLTAWAEGRMRWPRLIQPNYVKSVSDCMRDATRVMIQQGCSLETLLHWCQVGQSPTWAVHWHRYRQIDFLPRPTWPDVASFSAPRSLDSGLLDLDRMEGCSDLDILLLRGHSISLVQSTTPLLVVYSDYSAGYPRSWSTVLENLLRHLMDLSTRTGFEFSPHTITLTILLSVFEYQVCSSETEGFCRLKSMVINVWRVLHGQNPEQCLDFLQSDRMIYDHCARCHNSRMFLTEAGQLCVGPAGVQEGDKIVQLFGLPLPALLRPEQSWFTWAGAAYIDVEFPDVQDTSTLPPEVYEIR
jgi:hypothetical protein